MSQTKTSEEQQKDIQTQLTAQTSLMTGHLQLLTAHIALQVAQQTSQNAVQKAALADLLGLVTAQASLAKAKGSAPFAELQGIREGLASVAVAGKEGTLSVAVGTDGALLLRVKKELLLSLDQAASHILDSLPKTGPGFVLATDADVLSAHKSDVWQRRFELQMNNLDRAIQGATPGASDQGDLQPFSLGSALAGIQAVPFVLNAVSDAGKFFRVDRAVNLFNSSGEAHRILEVLLERRAHVGTQPAQVVRIDGLSSGVVEEAEKLLETLNTMGRLHHQGMERAGWLQRALEAAAKTNTDAADAKLPPAERLAQLREELASSKEVLDAFHPNKAPEEFWNQVSGQIRKKRMQDRGRIHLTVIAQTVQTHEKRVWRSDRLIGSGEVQVEYRVTDATGGYLDSGVRLYASATRDIFKDDGVQELDLPLVGK